MIGEPPMQSSLTVAVGPLSGLAGWPTPWRNWLTQAWGILAAVSQSGKTANRPATGLYPGRPYFDTDLGIPVWFDGTNWIDATGATV